MKTRHVILVVLVSILVILALYFLPSPFSPIQQLVVSTFKQSVLEEFESLDEIKLLKRNYEVTRTGENFNAFQHHFAKFYFVEPNGIAMPPLVNLVVIKDLTTGNIHMTGMCLPGSSEGYRLEQRQVMPYLQDYDCFEDTWVTQEILDETISPFQLCIGERTKSLIKTKLLMS